MIRHADRSLINRRGFAGALLGVTAAAALARTGSAGAAPAKTMRVYKSPTCGCCARWVDYVRADAWKVEVVDLQNVTSIKKQVGLLPQLASCHTAIVDGYVVEGHVPLPAIEKLMTERPDVHGIAVPGMPQDSPGMGGGGVQDVFAFTRDGRTRPFTRTAG
ncbi:hypothetical protein CKO28_19335 [Rhodovibrio sodomensis]|uniref:CopG family transcriptional regulator n=1 Tax=Rhodovibrio sodomensis TaxID=1088 RepID=A0ABS1DJL5_9PROT|nr:DUF411 domain-containing protein [Rhodovibrio sodomensis]MBK1670191.1 hypothetical protein [Rhodovibrio sodomensis]